MKNAGLFSSGLVSLSCWKQALPWKVRTEVAAAGRGGSSCLLNITLAKFSGPLKIKQMVMRDWEEHEQLALLHTSGQQVTGFGFLAAEQVVAVRNQAWLAQQHRKLGWAARALALDGSVQGTEACPPDRCSCVMCPHPPEPGLPLHLLRATICSL